MPEDFRSVLIFRPSILAAAWPSGTFAGNGLVITTWRPSSRSAGIGLAAILGYPQLLGRGDSYGDEPSRPVGVLGQGVKQTVKARFANSSRTSRRIRKVQT